MAQDSFIRAPMKRSSTTARRARPWCSSSHQVMPLVSSDTSAYTHIALHMVATCVTTATRTTMHSSLTPALMASSSRVRSSARRYQEASKAKPTM